MKKCPYCAENIQDEAIKCRFCGEWLSEKPQLSSQEINSQSSDMSTSKRIKLIGVGGGGSNAINRMIEFGITGFETICIHTNKENVIASNAQTRINIGKDITSGLGANVNPEIGKKAAEESNEDIKMALIGTDIAIITCGLGGGTGTGATPVIADIAKKMGIFTIGIFTKPFSFEGTRRSSLALEGLNEAKKIFDIIFLYENNRVLSVMDKNTPLLEAFSLIDQGIMTIVSFIKDIGSEDFQKLTLQKEIIDIDLVPLDQEELYEILFGSKDFQTSTGNNDSANLDIPAFIRNKSL